VTYLKEKNPHESMDNRVYKVLWNRVNIT
jgi:hypothetical protein